MLTDPSSIDQDLVERCLTEGVVHIEDIEEPDHSPRVHSEEDDDLLDEEEDEVDAKSMRLGREDYAPVVPFDDRPPLMERCQEVLGDRLVEKRGQGYFLDRRPANIDQIVAAAGLKYHDEDALPPSPPPRRPKRRRKLGGAPRPKAAKSPKAKPVKEAA